MGPRHSESLGSERLAVPHCLAAVHHFPLAVWERGNVGCGFNDPTWSSKIMPETRRFPALQMSRVHLQEPLADNQRSDSSSMTFGCIGPESSTCTQWWLNLWGMMIHGSFSGPTLLLKRDLSPALKYIFTFCSPSAFSQPSVGPWQVKMERIYFQQKTYALTHFWNVNI